MDNPPQGQAPLNGDSPALRALQDMIAEENGYLTGFLGIATYVDGQGAPGYSIYVDGQQSPVTMLGLHKMLARVVDRLADQML